MSTAEVLSTFFLKVLRITFDCPRWCAVVELSDHATRYTHWRLEITRASRQSRKLGRFRGLGAIRCATALALALVRTGVLATALTLAVILPRAGVLRRRFVLNEQDTGESSLNSLSIRLSRLSAQTDRGRADQTCKRGSQSKRLYRVLHENTSVIG